MVVGAEPVVEPGFISHLSNGGGVVRLWAKDGPLRLWHGVGVTVPGHAKIPEVVAGKVDVPPVTAVVVGVVLRVDVGVGPRVPPGRTTPSEGRGAVTVLTRPPRVAHGPPRGVPEGPLPVGHTLPVAQAPPQPSTGPPEDGVAHVPPVTVFHSRPTRRATPPRLHDSVPT